MEISVGSAPRRWGLAVIALVIGSILIWQACVVWLAHYRLNSDQVDLMERGAKLTPGDAAGWDRVGRLRQWDFMHPDLAAAIQDYQKAVGAEPRAAHYWMDLAGAYEAAGDDARAAEAFTRAKAVYPASGEVAFHYGNFLLRQGKYDAAFVELRSAVHADPTLLPLAISRTWRATEDSDELAKELLPPTSDAYLEAVDFLASTGQLDPALAMWRRLVALHQPFELSRSFSLLEDLIHEDRSGDARRVWSEAAAAAGLTPGGGVTESLVWNGDFSKDFANGGLDWRWKEVLGADFSFDSGPHGNGSRTLRLDFTGGRNLNLDVPFQYVPVEPGHSYHFHALIKTDGVTTESGVHFQIADPNHGGAVSVTTDDFTGSHDWTPIEADLSSSAQTHFLLVRVARSPSRLFDNKLGGTAWIADVALTPSRGQSGQQAQ